MFVAFTHNLNTEFIKTLREYSMKVMIGLSVSICLFFSLASQGIAQQLAAQELSFEQQIRQKFNSSRPGIQLGDIKPSAIDGLFSVQIVGGPILYATADVAHFLTGDMFAVVPGGFINIAEQEREIDRAKVMAGLNQEQQIIFDATEQPAKAVVTVFTDVDCYYCQKLHQEVPDLNRLGIEVRYMAYPRAGIGSESYKKIASAWCADDQQLAMTKLKNRQPIANNVCADNPVAEHFKLGHQLGVTGTPALITDQGRLMPGYMPALQLARALGVEVAPVLAAELAAKTAAQPKR